MQFRLPISFIIPSPSPVKCTWIRSFRAGQKISGADERQPGKHCQRREGQNRTLSMEPISARAVPYRNLRLSSSRLLGHLSFLNFVTANSAESFSPERGRRPAKYVSRTGCGSSVRGTPNIPPRSLGGLEKSSAVQLAGFSEFGGGAVGLASRRVAGGKAAADVELRPGRKVDAHGNGEAIDANNAPHSEGPVWVGRRFDPRQANGRNSARLAPCGPSRRRSPSRTDRSRSPFAPTQVDGLKIGSDTGTCFKVRV